MEEDKYSVRLIVSNSRSYLCLVSFAVLICSTNNGSATPFVVIPTNNFSIFDGKKKEQKEPKKLEEKKK